MQQHHRYRQLIASWEIVLLNVQRLNLHVQPAMAFTHQIRTVVLHGPLQRTYGQPEAVSRAFHRDRLQHQVQHAHRDLAATIHLGHPMEIA